jgi:hypothetical protein
MFSCVLPLSAKPVAEYQLKMAFIYNFISFTRWPTEIEQSIKLCIYGKNPFAEYIEEYQDNMVSGHQLEILQIHRLDQLNDCQVVFIAHSASENISEITNWLNGKPILTIADSTGATHQGVALNMAVDNNRITFQANLAAAQNNGLTLSSRLLSLATKVIQ